MGVRNDEVQEKIMAEREAVTDSSEPLLTVEMEIHVNGKASLRHTIPNQARDVLDLTEDDSVKIDIFEHGYFVRKA